MKAKNFGLTFILFLAFVFAVGFGIWFYYDNKTEAVEGTLTTKGEKVFDYGKEADWMSFDDHDFYIVVNARVFPFLKDRISEASMEGWSESKESEYIASRKNQTSLIVFNKSGSFVKEFNFNASRNVGSAVWLTKDVLLVKSYERKSREDIRQYIDIVTPFSGQDEIHPVPLDGHIGDLFLVHQNPNNENIFAAEYCLNGDGSFSGCNTRGVSVIDIQNYTIKKVLETRKEAVREFILGWDDKNLYIKTNGLVLFVVPIESLGI